MVAHYFLQYHICKFVFDKWRIHTHIHKLGKMNSEANLMVNASILCEELATLTANYNDCVPTRPISTHKGPVLEIFKKLKERLANVSKLNNDAQFLLTSKFAFLDSNDHNLNYGISNLIDKIYHRYFTKEAMLEDLAQAGHSFKLSKLSITVCRSSANFPKDVSIVS